MTGNSERLLSIVAGALFFWSLTATLASAQTVAFARKDFAVGANPITDAVGDFNGDRIQDLAVANKFQQRLGAAGQRQRDLPAGTERPRCGQAFGLGLYGLDLIETADGVRVVDLNFFPGYKGVPDAAPRIADYIEGHASGKLTLEGPPLPAADRPHPALASSVS